MPATRKEQPSAIFMPAIRRARQQGIRDENVETANADLAKLQALIGVGVGAATGNPYLMSAGASGIFGGGGDTKSMATADLLKELYGVGASEAVSAPIAGGKLVKKSLLAPKNYYRRLS
jgi:hypothetical protein